MAAMIAPIPSKDKAFSIFESFPIIQKAAWTGGFLP